MRYSILFFLVVIMGCSIHGTLVRSQGEVKNWSKKGYVNREGNLELVFTANNAYYENLEEVVAGITLSNDLKFNANNVVDEYFVIEMRVKAFSEGYVLEPTAKLSLDGVYFLPKNILYGTYTIKTGCVIKQKFNDRLMKVRVEFDESVYQCLIFEYQMPKPQADKAFTLYLHGGYEELVKEIIVEFHPISSNIYYH